MGLNYGKIPVIAYDPNNSQANVALDFKNDIPRIRYGGNGAGSANGFQIQGTGDAIKWKVDDNGNVTNYGGLNINGNDPVASLSQFAKSLSGSGYQKLPSGIILQWGQLSNVPNGTTTTAPFPMTFPNAVWQVVPCLVNSSGPCGWVQSTTTLQQVAVIQTQGSTRNVTYFAVGN